MIGVEYSCCLLVLLVLIIPEDKVAFIPEVEIPYNIVSGGTAQQNKLNSTLACDEQRNSFQDCATQCYSRSQNGIKYFHFKN